MNLKLYTFYQLPSSS